MFNKLSFALCTGVIFAGFVGHASAQCLTASGKIANNIQPGNITQGVIALKLDKQKLKCALIGNPQLGIEGEPNYLHTLVCDNKALPEDAQSQVTMKTWFTSPPVVTGGCDAQNPSGPIAFSFEEISIPDPSTARGEFIGITGVDYPSEITGTDSYITITGNYNCAGGITMQFDGQLCFSD